MIQTKLARGVCERGAWCLATVHKKAHTLVWQCASARQQSQPTHRPPPHAPHPRNHASPSHTAAQDSRVQPPAGCRQADTGQHRQFASGSLRRRARRPVWAGHRSPTKPTLYTASKDANHPTNTTRLGTWSLLTVQRPVARRRPITRPPSSRSRPPKRHRNLASHQNRRGATPRTHTGSSQRPTLGTTIPTP
jgi:hypothetical protein